MKKSVILLAIAAMGLLLLTAVAWDSLRYVSDARNRWQLADTEMKKHEERLVKLLSGSKQTSPEVQAAIAAHEATDGQQARHEAYDKLVADCRQTMSDKIDPTNPLDRKFMDDIAGAINRREIAQKQFDVESTAYQQSLSGLRGKLARLLSAQARAAWKSGS